jgi:hypothetical protein
LPLTLNGYSVFIKKRGFRSSFVSKPTFSIFYLHFGSIFLEPDESDGLLYSIREAFSCVYVLVVSNLIFRLSNSLYSLFIVIPKLVRTANKVIEPIIEVITMLVLVHLPVLRLDSSKLIICLFCFFHHGQVYLQVLQFLLIIFH